MPLWDEVRTSGRNEKFRENYVRNWIRTLGDGHGRTFLDVGAGNMPYRKQINEAGFDYLGHDFGQYTGDNQHPGLHASNANWTTSGHDITCDIVELPKNIADFIICTEVLEHVPDPLAALNSISTALKADGRALITVPLQSRMHQTPYWFVSGLSPYSLRTGRTKSNSNYKSRGLCRPNNSRIRSVRKYLEVGPRNSIYTAYPCADYAKIKH